MVNINLLDSRRKDIVKRQQLALKFNLVSFVVVAICGIIYGGIFYYNLRLSNSLETLDKQIAASESEVGTFNDIVEEGALVADRLNSVEEILKSRQLLDKKLDLYFDIFASKNALLREVGFGDEENPDDLIISGSIKNVTLLPDFFEEFNAIVGKYELESVFMDNLVRGIDGTYKFNYLLSFPTEQTGVERK